VKRVSLLVKGIVKPSKQHENIKQKEVKMSEKMKRSYSRNYHEAPILVLKKKNYSNYMKERYYYAHAQMYNCDKGGVYFETDHAIQPGQNVSIKIEEFPYEADQSSGACIIHYARVKWCKEMEGAPDTRYGMGAQIFETVVPEEIR
jgi:hypothetical protein